MKKIVTGILYGGQSVEHDISVISASNIVNKIDKDIFEFHLLGIAKDGTWYLCDSIDQPITQGDPITLLLNGASPEFGTDSKRIIFDVIFPVLHGTDGEDGSVQGLLQTFNIACVGSGVLGSAASMDKLLAKRILQHDGIPVADFMTFKRSEIDKIDYHEITTKLGVPFILKPTNLGSSIGVAKINSEDGFLEKLHEAFRFDDVILFEEFIDGREMECAILGNSEPIASVPGEITLNNNYDLYSFQAKYVDPNAATLTIPAEVSKEVSNAIKKFSLRAFKLLNCADFSRIDLFVKNNGMVYVNEVNTIPGFTDISMYPKLMAHEGVSYTKLITTLIEMAIERHNIHNELSTNFESDLN